MSMSRGFNVVSLFSGCGGSSLGYKMAGGDVILAVDFDKDAVKAYRDNFPQANVIERDIYNLSVGEILESIGVGELDILDGSPPCQGFSRIKQIKDHARVGDLRNALYKEYARVLAGLQPKAFIMENVPGLVNGVMRFVFSDIMSSLANQGYNVRCWKLDASCFGVPQKRERMVFIGARKDLGVIPSCPKPTSKQVSVGDALCFDFSYKVYDGGGSLMNPRWKIKHSSAPFPTVGAIGVGGLYHGEFKIVESASGVERSLTIDELKVIQSFPRSFIVPANAVGRKLIGNAVPLLLMNAVAEHVYDTIVVKAVLPKPVDKPAVSCQPA